MFRKLLNSKKSSKSELLTDNEEESNKNKLLLIEVNENQRLELLRQEEHEKELKEAELTKAKNHKIIYKAYNEVEQNQLNDIKTQYHLIYPISTLNPNEQKDFVNIVEKALILKSLITFHPNYDCFDAIMFSLRYLAEKKYVSYKHNEFLDCMGYGGAACFYASVFGFKAISGAEISKEGYEYALSIKHLIYENPQYQYLRPNIYLKFGYGSFQDYFSADANIVFLDCGIACTDSFLDEGVLLSLLFTMCQKLIPGSYLIIITIALQLTTSNCHHMGYKYLECVCDKKLESSTDTSTNNKNENTTATLQYSKHIWILKTSRII